MGGFLLPKGNIMILNYFKTKRQLFNEIEQLKEKLRDQTRENELMENALNTALNRHEDLKEKLKQTNEEIIRLKIKCKQMADENVKRPRFSAKRKKRKYMI